MNQLKDLENSFTLINSLIKQKVQEEEFSYPLGGILSSIRESVVALDKLLKQHNQHSFITKEEVETLIVHWKRLSGSIKSVRFVHSGGSGYSEFNMTFIRVTDLEEIFNDWTDNNFQVHTLSTNPYTIELEPNR